MLRNNKATVKLIEEMSELTKELAKTLQYAEDRHLSIEEEIGDVIASIKLYMQFHPNIDENAVDKRVKYKMQRYKEYTLNE